MKRVFLDANVIFSAAYMDRGAIHSLFDIAKKRGDVSFIATGHVVTEATRNLRRKSPSRLSELETLLENVAVLEEPPPRLVEELAPLVPDPDDAPILAGAISGEAALLVTGNEKDFRDLYDTEVRGVRVLRPRDALALLTP